MVQKSTKQEFVLKARQKHNDLDASCYKYDYDLFIYVNNHTKGIISCREHGTFNQTPVNHLSGKGCKKCANKALAKLKADSPEQFFEKANKKHNFRYNYERFIYTDSQTKGTIICSEHGAFDQRPANHILGAGCPKCGIIQRAIAATKNHEKFIEEGNLIHDSKYKYPEMYKSAYAKIKIECPIHGIFIQTPQDHVNGNGCIKCAGSYKPSHEEFIAKANLTHKYKYKYKSTYNGCDVKICITCAIHGDFWQTPYIHNNMGCGCPKCTHTVSKLETEWLDSLNVPKEWRTQKIKVNGRWFNVDALDIKNRTIYEFNGDYWHGNPKIFDDKEINPVRKLTYGQLHQMTLDKQKFLESADYIVISIWENEWMQIKKELKNNPQLLFNYEI